MAPRRTRPAAVLLAGLVLAAACGTGEGDRAADPVPSSTGPPALTAPGDTAPGAEAPPPDGTTPAGGTAGPGAPQPEPVAPAPDGEPGEEPPPSVGPVGPVGSLATRYLRPEASDQVLVQVLAQDGAAPRPAVPERIRDVLAQLSGKRVVLASGHLDGGARSWTSDDLRALADSSSPAQTPQQAVLTLLFLRGGFADSERAVGVAVRGDVAAVFAERVDEASGMLGNRDAVEDAVTMHELGHLLGLVDLVLDTGRADPEHPGHSPNRGSVMYYAVESTVLGTVLTGGPPRDFDQADLDDLARIRNG